jgi:Kdo2-lipid IVA lauroyltransferase/acyltransferase
VSADVRGNLIMGMYWGLIVFRYIGAHVPERAMRFLVRLIAGIVFLMLPGKRANVYRNLNVALGAGSQDASPTFAKRVRRLGRHSMRSYGEILLDFAAFDRVVERVRRDTLDTEGWEHVDQVLAAGRGAIFVTAHFGHWDMAAAALAHHSPGKIFAVAETFANRRLNTLVGEIRASYGLSVVPMDNVRQMTRVLRDGNILGILADRPVSSGDGVPVQFFGHRTSFPAGAATLALLARCPIVVGSLRRRSDGSFHGLILPPFEPVRVGTRAQDVAATMQLVVDGLERVIRASPSQWYMFRDMWGAGEIQQAPRSRHWWADTLGTMVRTAISSARRAEAAVQRTIVPVREAWDGQA